MLDQGETSACTGYALATVIHHELRRRRNREYRVADCVSTDMLYTMAKRYDEWPGETYDGSSCRGAMKAWHKHGACLNDYWPDEMEEKGWDDARTRPLGAYFRVNHRDLIAMHAALADVGILYASAIVHSGWDDVGADGRIEYRTDKAGIKADLERLLHDRPADHDGEPRIGQLPGHVASLPFHDLAVGPGGVSEVRETALKEHKQRLNPATRFHHDLSCFEPCGRPVCKQPPQFLLRKVPQRAMLL